MMSDVDVFVGNTSYIDPDVYSLWLQGLTVDGIASSLQKKGILQKYGATYSILQSDIRDQFKIFDKMEEMIQDPVAFKDQIVFQMPSISEQFLIDNYYKFDHVVIRELIGRSKRLARGNKNIINDISEKTKIPFVSCNRQFSNLKQISKVVEELKGELVNNIVGNFLLPHDLAQNYAVFVFLNFHRFDLNTKKLPNLKLRTLIQCGSVIMKYWTCNGNELNLQDGSDLELDREFLNELKNFKVVVDSKIMDDHKRLTVSKIKGKLSHCASCNLESNSKVLRVGRSLVNIGLPSFEDLSKIIIDIAVTFHERKDQRDFFLDLAGKIVEPLRNTGWSQEDLSIFLKSYSESGQQLDVFLHNETWQNLWSRFMDVIIKCAINIHSDL